MHNHSDFKSSLLGRFSRAVAIANYDVASQKGFTLMATPDVKSGVRTNPYDPAVLLACFSCTTNL